MKSKIQYPLNRDQMMARLEELHQEKRRIDAMQELEQNATIQLQEDGGRVVDMSMRPHPITHHGKGPKRDPDTYHERGNIMLERGRLEAFAELKQVLPEIRNLDGDIAVLKEQIAVLMRRRRGKIAGLSQQAQVILSEQEWECRDGWRYTMTQDRTLQYVERFSLEQEQLDLEGNER